MAIPNNSIHPLDRNGTAQRDRLLKSLIPGQLVLDNRNFADLLAFAGSYAKEIRYWGPGNKDEGDWTDFWEKDATSLLAIVASTDLNAPRIQYRNNELAYIRECKKERKEKEKSICDNASNKYLPSLIVQIYDLVLKIQEICKSLPATNPLKLEVIALIGEKLAFNGQLNGGSAFEKLIKYHKTGNELLKQNKRQVQQSEDQNDQYDPEMPLAAEDLITLYESFFGDTACEKVWALSVDDFNCIDFQQDLGAGDRDALWQLFLQFYKILSVIISKAQKSFQQALNGRSDHPPHIALFLAFTLLFRRYHQQDMNAMADRHLSYYYQDVLRLQDRQAIPDRVHIVFRLAENAVSYKLGKDTLLLGGKDSKGLDLLYGLVDETVINTVALIEKQSLYFYKTAARTIPLALPAADTKDGLAIPFEPDHKVWHPLSGRAVYTKYETKQKLLAIRDKKIPEDKLTRTQIDKAVIAASRIVANPGLIISSPELWLGKGGTRKIIITFVATSKPKFLDQFYTEISTSEGLLTLTNTPVENFAEKYNQPDSSYRIVPGEAVEWQINLPADSADIAPLENDPNPVFGKQPYIRLLMKDTSDYDALSAITFSEIHVVTSNQGFSNLQLQLGGTQYTPASDIPLVGSTIPQEMTLYATSPEISVKRFERDGQPGLTGLVNISGQEFHLEHPIIEFGEDEFRRREPLDNLLDAGDLLYSPVTKYSFIRKNIKILASGNVAKPIIIYKIPGETIRMSYTSVGVVLRPGSNNETNRLYHVDFLGGYAQVRRNTILPAHELPELENGIEIEVKPVATLSPIEKSGADGNLRLGFEKVVPGQTLSLLLHFADGTGNPDHIAPGEIIWSYLRSNEWVRIPPQFILTDETLGLQETGIIRFQLPSDINNGNTLSVGLDGRTDLYWIQASASEDIEQNIFVDALPMLEDIYVQAATAVFQNDNSNDLIHLEKGLPAHSISQLRFSDPAISSVQQPFSTFGGRYSEAGDRISYYRRIHERLRHRQRAVNVWDYERLTLEEFTKVAVAKCLPHTRDTDIARPGYVTMGVIPFPENMIGDRIFYPTFNAGQLEKIEQYLKKYNSFFVSGRGGGVVCCCASGDEGCGCHDQGTLVVRNAIFEPVRLQVCVRFRTGKEFAYYRKKLNGDLKSFLSPWAATPGYAIVFGAKISSMQLLRFLENLDYVDVVMGLKVKHFPGRQFSESNETSIAFEEVESIEPFTSRSVLTTYLDMLNEDNPNVIDHDIQVIENTACCADCN